jgi:hypothetical protein
LEERRTNDVVIGHFSVETTSPARGNLPATVEQAAEYMTWFVNRRAYNRQTDRPDEKAGKHFFYQARDRQTKSGWLSTSRSFGST